MGAKDTKFLNAEAKRSLLDYSTTPRIILIDDDLSFGQSLMEAAIKDKITVTQVESFQDVEQLDNWKYDVVIMKHGQGECFKSAVEFARRLEEKDPGLPIIMISSFADDENREKPTFVKSSIPKLLGVHSILERAVEAYYESIPEI